MKLVLVLVVVLVVVVVRGSALDVSGLGVQRGHFVPRVCHPL